MAALTLALALLAPGSVPFAGPSGIVGPGDPVDPWRGLAQEASLRFGVPSDWIVAVLRAESGGRTHRGGAPIRSTKGAIGLMQLMPATWAELRASLGLGTDPDDPRDNILAGTAYLRRMYDQFGYPGLFGAYNAGPGRYSAWQRGEASLPAETIAYLAKVTGSAPPARRLPSIAASVSTAAPEPLFAFRAARGATDGATGPASAAREPPSMFAIRRDVR